MSKDLAHRILQDLRELRNSLRRMPTRPEFRRECKYTDEQIKDAGGWLTLYNTANRESLPEIPRDPKILVYDIETAPMLAYVWGLWDQTVGLNQIASDWHLMSWAAKWLDQKEVMYMDQRSAKDIKDDKPLLEGLWKLMDEADVIVGQNSKQFDTKKINARFLIQGMGPPSQFQQIDTRQLAKRHFGLTSNKLEYMSEHVNKTHKKSKHKEFHGFELWLECMKGNLRAWKEMEKYNKQDVLATEELYKKLAPWGGTGVDINSLRGDAVFTCQCGSSNFVRSGYAYTKSGKFQRYYCNDCGAWFKESGALRNMMSSKKKDSLRGL